MKYILLGLTIIVVLFLSACEPSEIGTVRDAFEIGVATLKPARFEDKEYEVVCYTNSSGLFCFTFDQLDISSLKGK